MKGVVPAEIARKVIEPHVEWHETCELCLVIRPPCFGFLVIEIGIGLLMKLGKVRVLPS